MKEGNPHKTKVLFFISSLEGGGAEHVMITILSALDRNRYEPSLLLLYPYEDSPYRDRIPADVGITVVSRKNDTAAAKIMQFIALMKTFRKAAPDVIASMLTHNNLMAVLAGLIFGIRTVVCEHIMLSEVVKTKEGKKVLWFPVSNLVRVLYRKAGGILAVSRGIKDDLAGNFSIAPDKIRVIYNPIDRTRIAELSSMPAEHPFFQGHGPVIMGIGRLTAQKGFDVLLKAFSRVSAVLDARLVILGKGIEKQSLQRLAMDLGVGDKVSFAGFRENPYALLARSDIFVLSSRYEGFPMVLLEAAACGVPTIATDCRSGPAEMLEGGKYGLLVPVGDADALAERIMRLLDDHCLREHFSKLGKERSRDFSVETTVKKYEQAIDESLGA